MRRILVAYDGGVHGRAALVLAARLARAFTARVDVVSVVPGGFAARDDRGIDTAIAHARSLVEAREALRGEGIDAGLVEPAGDPAETIVRLAEEGGYDTLIVGASRGAAGRTDAGDGVVSRLAVTAGTTLIVARDRGDASAPA
ncbi:MAG: universal stress protein [Chloroflexota bacterium]